MVRKMVLDADTPRGNHLVEATYLPAVPYFQQRRPARLIVEDSPNDDPIPPRPGSRWQDCEGDDLTVNVSLVDNTGSPVPASTISFSVNGQLNGTATTDQEGIASYTLTVDDRERIGHGPLCNVLASSVQPAYLAAQTQYEL